MEGFEDMKLSTKRKSEHVSSMTFVRLQNRLDGAARKMTTFLQHDVQEKVRLEGIVREAAFITLQEVREAELDLFERYVFWCAPVEVELRLVTQLEFEHVLETRVEAAILTARRQIGASALIGQEALAAAERLGVGILPETEREPANPWADLGVKPLWEASYRNAVTRLVHLRVVRYRKTGYHQHKGFEHALEHHMATRHQPTRQSFVGQHSTAPSFRREANSAHLWTGEPSFKVSARRELLERAQTRQARGQQRMKDLISRIVKTGHWRRNRRSSLQRWSESVA